MHHIVAVIGGAAAGAEVAGCLAKLGVTVAVFERRSRPYGKIEDGLPRWHINLRKKVCQEIDTKLDQANVHFVPRTALGQDISLEEIISGWGFSAVVLASGAWRDRPLPIANEQRYRDRGLIYQNPFVAAYNHAEDRDFKGPRYEIRDNVIVVGGGLASIDVVKMIMLETTQKALQRHSIQPSLVELETRGIPRTLKKYGLEWKDLGLQGCTLLYRRGPKNLALVPLESNASPERVTKVESLRIRSIEKAMAKYCFHFEPYTSVKDLITENDQVTGLRLQRTQDVNGQLTFTEEMWSQSCSYVVSSIGSIPEPIQGLPMENEFYTFTDRHFGRISEFPNLFATGNAVTGHGNIVASRKHARKVCEDEIEKYLRIGEKYPEILPFRKQMNAENNLSDKGVDCLTKSPVLSPERYNLIMERIKERQAGVGYSGDYQAWIRQSGASFLSESEGDL